MNRIKDERKKRNLLQKEVAELISVDRTTYAKYETGAIIPPVGVLIRIAELFGVSVDYLIEHDAINVGYKPFGDILKTLRTSKGLTQQELASIIGVDQSSIGKYEGKEHKVPSDDVKERIADYFGVSIDYLMGRTDTAESHIADPDDETLEITMLYKSLNSEAKKIAKTVLKELSAIKSIPEKRIECMNRIRELRISKGFTMKQLGEMIGVTESTISFYETGKHEPSIKALGQIADILDTSIDYMVGHSTKTEADLCPEEREILELYRVLNDLGKETAVNALRAFASYRNMMDLNT